MIDRNSNRKVAQSTKAKAKSEKALNDQVLSLVHAANETALPERHVTPRAALIVMARAMKELASLPEESRNHGVLREVTKFISLNQKTLLASVSTKHADLLPKGHPLSPLNASLTSEDLRKKYAEWIAADPAISDEARPLVAMAHSLPPESIEREHAFLRLRSLQASAVPAYFKIDDVTAITAAFSSGNSSAARRARVALQWRDRFGQWVEMGRGINFRFRLPDGSIQVARGNYVGAGSNSIVERTATGTSLTSEFGLIEVSGVPGLQPGLYPVSSSNAAVYQARIPGMEAPEEPSFKDQFDQDIPSVSDLSGARKELPIGWKKQGPYYVSDDNYAVIPGPNGQPQSVTRLNADGRPGGTVGNARNWAEANALIEKDQPEFDKEIARLEEESGELPLARIPGATEEDVVDFKDIAKTQQQRAEENKKFDAQRPAPRPLSDKDLNGNVVPNAWTRDANDDKSYTREMPLRDGGTYPIIARLNDDGTYIAGHSGGWIPAEGTDGRGPSRRFESWDEIDNQGVPGLVDYLNDTFTKDNPIVRDKDAVMYYVDEDGNRVPGAAPQTEPTTPEQVKKAEQDLRRNMEKNLPPREFPQEPRDDRYDAIFDKPLFGERDLELRDLGKAAAKALREVMDRETSGDYSRDGVTFYRPETGPSEKSDTISVIPDAWEPGDKIIAKIEPDGKIDWESDEQYDKYADNMREALRGIATSGSGPADTSRGIWGSTNSIEKPDGKEYDIILAEMDDLWDDEKTIMQHIVDQANDLGIYVDLSPQQTGLAFGDERVVRFTFPEKTVSEELARKLIGDGPDSNEDGILMSRLSTQEDWKEAFQDITGSGPGEPPSGPGEQPAGMELDFADPEQAAEDAGLPEDAPLKDIVNAWFNQNIKPVAPTAKLDVVEQGALTPVIRISADNEEDLLNAFRVYFGDDEATLEVLRENSEEYVPGTRDEGSITVPADSVTVARDRDDESVIVRMPDGSLVEYDVYENVRPLSRKETSELLDDFRGEENIPWRDEDGQMFFEEALKDEGGPGEPPSGTGGRTPDSISADDAKELSNLVDNTYSVDALDSEYEVYKDKNGNLTLRAHVEDGTEGGVVLSGFTYIDVATISDDGKVTWKNDSLREEHQDNFIPAMNSILFMHDLNAGRPRPNDFIYFDGETGETIDTSLTEFPESFKEYFDNLTKKVHAAGGSIEDEELSSKELKSLLSRPSGSIFRVFLPKNISDDTLKDIVKAGSIEGLNDDDESVQDYVDLINKQRGPDEPPSPGGGTPPKAPSPSTPGSPALFGDFDKPAGAYQLRTTEYEPEGRIDEESTDFTDDPRRLATKFSLSDLVAAFTQALIGRPNDDAMQDILDANVGDDDDLPDLADLEDVTNSPARRAGEVSGTGSGALEFNAGEEFVLAEALYNAVYEAGGDPNRVIANAYDAVNGNRNNVRKLLDAQGGVSSPEDVQLIEDMTDEIRQIKEADPDDESPAYKRSESEKKITGSLIENVPVDYDNPDYFDMDTDPYIPSVPDIDENGYTDNPRILAADYNPADLIDQMLDAITDGSGVALLDFGGDAGVAEVPAEALRDALQLLNINTNEILFKLRDESNDMSEEEPKPETPEAQEVPTETPQSAQPSVEFAPFSDALADVNEEDPSTSPQTVLMLDDAANALVNLFSNGMSPDVKFIGYNPNTGILLVETTSTDFEEARTIAIHPNGGATSLEADIDWFSSPSGRAFGWTDVPEGVEQAIRQEVALRSPNATPAPAAPAPAAPSTEAPASTFVYPGAREAGYSVNNTTLASDGSVVGAGSIVTANRDGKRGTVVSIQNDPEYVRIKFDDGKVAVRSANQIKAVSNPDGSLATAPSGSLAPSPATPSTDVESRLDAPIRPAPNVARSGAAWGINDTSEIPDNIKPLVQEGVVQSDFSAWGDRDAEIAKAATTRASFESLAAALKAVADASDSRDVQAKINADKALNEIVKDIFGSRQGVSFGSEGFSINATSVRSYVRSDAQERQSGKERYSLSIGFLVEKNGREVGDGTRSMSIEVTTDAQGNKTYEATVKNEILRIAGGNKKKGFASAYNRYMENWYIANGIEKVKVFAAGGGSWQGAFVWALNGFNWQDQYIAADVIGLLKRRARTPEEKALVEKLNQKLAASGGDLNSLPTPLEVALVGWYPGAENWLGKEVLIQKPWDGVKHLTPDAREQQQAINYNQIKNAERRIKAGQNKPNMSANALAQVMDNEFQADNPELGPHMEAIRDALRNNRPLGFLSPAAKAVLNSYVSKQLLNKDSKMPMDDLFRLRTGLDAEYRADYDFADPFGGIGEALTDFSVDDFLENSEVLQAAGFTATPLGKYETGQNTTFKVIHKQSGQVFFVKEENLSREWNGVRGLTSEVEANVVLNALGLHGIPDVRASRENPDVFIMSEAGATLPISASPVNAEKMFYDGVVNPEAGNRFFGNNGTFVDMLSNPEDILSMAIIDMLGDSEDRHDANWMVAFDNATNKLRIFPIDHGLINIDTDDDSIASFLGRNWPSAGDVYQSAIPRLIDTAGEARTKEMFLNQVDKLITNLDNPLFQPKGEELAAIIEKWGSYNAFKDAMKERLARIATPGTAENDALAKSMKRNYWRS
jgi:hypothetical protein